jgi:hypothetical protein
MLAPALANAPAISVAPITMAIVACHPPLVGWIMGVKVSHFRPVEGRRLMTRSTASARVGADRHPLFLSPRFPDWTRFWSWAGAFPLCLKVVRELCWHHDRPSA